MSNIPLFFKDVDTGAFYESESGYFMRLDFNIIGPKECDYCTYQGYSNFKKVKIKNCDTCNKNAIDKKTKPIS
ncbi:hypothetical protein FUMI01_11090 [Flavobacterium sp. UMI-01]|nr:hypothetical protein FUMI01_11090 [Flavobacterium sp. UMI-01]